ncbi:MAG TPA: hypothetical protein VG075_02250 [Candidatus Acidoferrum sp.]|jgi:TolB-like protein|nr:hypothetical protein [Candidatus Acidoferrum sp.]
MSETFPDTAPSVKPAEDRLDSWKEIAAYLNRDVTTVQRWEKREGMPVHRHVHDKLGSVYASRAELDAWARGRKPQGEAENGNEAPSSNAAAPATTMGVREGLSGRIKVAIAAAALAVVVVLTAFAIYRVTRAPSGESQGRLVIAVVPLENLSGDPGQDFFVNGLTEEVITQLGQLNPERIGVVRYGSSSTARQSGSLIAELRQRAGLQYLLEGSVRRQEEQARISIRLVRVADETTVWTESFDRSVGDVLALQSEIAQRIGRELQIRILGVTKRKPVDSAVVEAYFKGRFELGQHTLPVPDAARAYFEKAIALDPSYAPAYAGLADFYSSRAVGEDEGSEEAWRQAEKYANQALRLDSESAETHTAIAEIKLMHDWDWRAAREHALRALQLNPSLPEAHAVYARYLRTAGKVEEALNQRKQAVALDPFRADLKEQLTLEEYFAREYGSIVADARLALANDPNDQTPHEELCINLGRLGLFDESAAECGRQIVQEGHAGWAVEYAREYRKHGYAAAGLLVAKKRLNEIRKRPQADLWDLANAYVAADMRDDAFRALFQGLKTHEPGLLQIRVDPDFDSIRSDPRYTELVRQIGFPTE